jgi:hypothetical protein
MAAHGITTADAIVDHFAKRLLDGRIDPDVRQKFVDFMNQGPDGKPLTATQKHPQSHDSHDNHDYNQAHTRDMIHLMMTIPEYQLA